MRISSYSFILILLKLHRCFGHGLKICMWFGYNPQIIFCPPPFRRKAEGHSFRHSVLPSVLPSFRPPNIVGTLCAQLLLQFYADPLKLYRCFSHGLKICMWFGYYPEIIFCHFFRNLNLVIFRRFYYQSEKIVGTLCAQLLLQFYIDSFETSQVFCTWSEDMHVVWIYSSDYFLTLFPPVELSHFSDIFTIKVNG